MLYRGSDRRAAGAGNHRASARSARADGQGLLADRTRSAMAKRSKPMTARLGCSRIMPGRGRARVGRCACSNRYPDALESYDEALRIQPRYAWAWKGRGMILERLGRIEDALACYRTAAEIDPGRRVELVQPGRRAAQPRPRGRSDYGARTGRWKSIRRTRIAGRSWDRFTACRAITCRRFTLTNRRSGSTRPTRGRTTATGLVLKAIGNFKEALLSFKRAARYQPDEVWHWYNVTEMLVELRQYEDALQPAQQAVARRSQARL